MTGPVENARPCFGCQVFDTHPRHEIINMDGSDAAGGPMHLDCCADLRNCDLCHIQLERAREHAGEDLHGHELGAVLEYIGPLFLQHAETPASPFDVASAQETMF